jgi:thioredoxin-related protein
MKHIFFFLLFAGFAFSTNAQEVKWHTFEEAIKLNQTAPRKIMVDVYTDWCGWCKVMDKKTFSQEVIAEYLNNKYYAVKFNAEQKEDIILGNDTLKYIPNGQRGYHQLAAALLNNKLSYPSVVFLDEQSKIIHVQQGFTKAQPFDVMLKYIGGSHYNNTPWETWSKTYKSPIISEE